MGISEGLNHTKLLEGSPEGKDGDVRLSTSVQVFKSCTFPFGALTFPGSATFALTACGSSYRLTKAHFRENKRRQ